MKRHIPGLHEASVAVTDIPDGYFLVSVDNVYYRHDHQKPFLILRLIIAEPKEYCGRQLSGRLYCSVKALWKLNWFLRDFGYDIELLGRDEIDDKALIGLRGVVKITHTTVNGQQYLNLDGFAPAANWDDFQLELAG